MSALTDVQRSAVEDRDGGLCVDAGAGSGKTTVLVGRIADILAKGDAALDEIVAITFTELAARELKDRLRGEFRKRANAAEREPEKMTFWRGLERRADAARISTIHGFCAAILRERALHIGLDPDFVVLDETEAHLLRERVIVDEVHGLLAGDDAGAISVAALLGMRQLVAALHKTLQSPEAMAAVAARYDYSSVEGLTASLRHAHDGLAAIVLENYCQSGKTRRMRQLLEAFDGVCTNPEDGREQKRIAMIGALDAMLAFESASSVERAVGALNAISAKASKDNWGGDLKPITKVQTTVKGYLDKVPVLSWDEDVEGEAAALTCAFYGLYLRVRDAYAEAKRARSGIDFSGLIHGAADAIRAGGLSSPIRHLLIDEFQDTDSRQYGLAQELLHAHEGTDGSLFIVGDAKQSIYGWRGAEVDVFRRAREDMNRDPKYLVTNFRSIPEILGFCNDFFEKTKLLERVESPYRGLEAHRNSLPGPRVEFLLAPTEENASVSEGRVSEADLLARRIMEWCGDGGVVVGDEARPAQLGDIALIMRTRSDLAIYEQALRRYGIDYRIESGPGFYARQEVIDVRNLIAVVIDPWDESALLAYLRSPIAGLTDDAIFQLSRMGGLAQAFNGDATLGGDDGALLERARQLVRDLVEQRTAPLSVFVRGLIERTGIESIYLGQSFLSRQRAANIRKVVALADGFSGTSTPSIAAFARYLDDVSLHEMREGEAALPEDDGGSVRIMTVHQAKGLEFPIVALIDTARGRRGGQNRSPLFLHRDIGMALRPADDLGDKQECIVDRAVSAVDDRSQEEEDSRVLYVAMTRARDYLVVSGAPGVKNVAESWLGSFLGAYKLGDAADGEVVHSTVDILVKRSAVANRLESTASKAVTWPGDEQLREQIGPSPLRRSGLPRMSATVLAKGIVEQRGEALAHGSGQEDVSRDARRAMARGTMVHELLEMWQRDSNVETLIEGLVESHIELPRERAKVISELQAMAARLRGHTLFQKVLADERAEREAVFTLAFDDGIVEGTADVALSDGGIVDYKTGAPGDAPAPEYVAQLQLYAYARQVLTGVTPTRGELFYVDTLDVCSVDVSPEALARITDEAAAVFRSERAL